MLVSFGKKKWNVAFMLHNKKSINTFRNCFLVWCRYFQQLHLVESESEVTWGQVWWPILGICVLHLTHSSAHTPWTHTHPEQWAANAAAPGEQLGVRCLAQGSHLSRGIEGGRERWLFTPPTDNSCRTWDSNPQPSCYKSDSLTIRPQLTLV